MTFTVPIEEQEAMLLRADATAIQGVNAGYGGPFGAVLRVYYPNGGEMLTYDFADTHNRVRSTGFPGAHAEHNAMELAIQNGLYEFLGTHPGSAVVLFTSGESCSNCRTKEEILARDLIANGLIQPKLFIVYYGATFDDAKQLAGFNDAPYLADFQKPPNDRKIPVEIKPLARSTPKDTGHFVQVFRNNETLAAVLNGISERSVLHNYATMAIETATALQLQNDQSMPWDLNGANLMIYQGHDKITIANAVIGPLTYATAQWANIGKIVLAYHPDILHGKPAQDTDNIDNKNLFPIVAGPYDQSDAVVTFATSSVRNKLLAQRHWGELLRTGQLPPTTLYNGMKM